MYKNYIKPINKKNLGVGALKVEGPIVQKESIALEVTTWHRHTEKSSVEYLTKPVL